LYLELVLVIHYTYNITGKHIRIIIENNKLLKPNVKSIQHYRLVTIQSLSQMVM